MRCKSVVGVYSLMLADAHFLTWVVTIGMKVPPQRKQQSIRSNLGSEVSSQVYNTLELFKAGE